MKSLALVLCICYISQIRISLCSESKLSDSKLLLPYHSYTAVNYTLSGSDGSCYKWQSSSTEIATVTPIFEGNPDCSIQAVVTAVWQTPRRATATIYAQNAVTGHIVKCDVIVDNMHHLEIETTTQELYLHDAPEALVAKGYDEFGNTFTTLEGLPFEWRIHSVEKSGQQMTEGHTVLRFITWTESEYATPPHIGELEAQGLQGFMQLVSGLKTGWARASVSMKPSMYRGVRSAEVKLLVMVDSILAPALVYVLPQAQVKYHVYVVSHGSRQEVQMPSEQYLLRINDSQLASLDADTSTVTALQFGETEITLIDRNIEETFRKPTSLLRIVEPGYLSFAVLPGRRWVLEVGREYEVMVEVHDPNSHTIHASDNLRLKTTFPGSWFEVLESSQNGTYHRVRPLKRGVALIEGVLAQIMLPSGYMHTLKSPARGSQEAEIYDSIEVIPPEVVLPWDTRLATELAAFPLRAKGGSGEYTWSVARSKEKTSDVIAVSVRGEVIPKGPGEAVVVAADVRNLINSGTAHVSVVPPAGLAFLPGPVEAKLGKTERLEVLLQMTDAQGRPMSDCRMLPFELRATDDTVLRATVASENTTSARNASDGSCLRVLVEGLKVGFTELEAIYRYPVPTDQPLVAKVTLGVYRPTRFHDPESVAVVAVGSTRKLLVVGGPRPWILDPSQYFYRLEVTGSQKKREVESGEVLPGDRGIRFLFRCGAAEEAVVTAVVGNKPTAKNLQPAVSVTTIKFVCAVPTRLRMVPELNLPKGLPPCPMANDTDNQQVPAQNTRALRIFLVFTDREGREFDKVTSLATSVSLRDPATSKASPLVAESSPAVEDDDEASISRPWFLVTPAVLAESAGRVAVAGAAKGYRRRENGPDYSVEAKLDLFFSPNLELVPQAITAFDDPEAHLSFRIEHGSGYFHITPSSDLRILASPEKPLGKGKAASPNQRDTPHHTDVRDFHLEPLRETHTHLPVYDLCFAMDAPPSLEVKIVSLASIELFVVDKLQMGAEATALARALDSDGQPINARYVEYMHLKPVMVGGADVLATLGQLEAWPEHGETSLRFKVKGTALGAARVAVEGSRRDGVVITSNPRDVQVFPPLRLDPREVTLIVGCELQLLALGGPQPAAIEFSLVDHTDRKAKATGSRIELVGSSGLVRGLTAGGPVTVRARAVGTDPVSGDAQAVYSQDEGTVRVVVLEAARIVVPVSVLTVGSVAPLWATGLSEDLSPLSMSAAQPPLLYSWTVSPPEPAVARLEHALYPYAVWPNKSHLNSGLRIRALAAGQVTLRLTVKSTSPRAGQIRSGEGRTELTAKLTLRVIDPLALTSPGRINQRLLMTPDSQIQLRTNRDATSRVEYLLTHCSRLNCGITMSPSGTLKVAPSAPSPSEPIVLLVKSSETPPGADASMAANQTLALLVEVKPVAYLLVSPVAESIGQVEEGQRLSALPVGGPYRLKVTFHDSLGATFDVVSDASEVRVRQSRYDRIEASLNPSGESQRASTDSARLDQGSTGLTVRVTGEAGETVLRVRHMGDPRLRDYVTVPSGFGLVGSKQEGVVNGDRLCFTPCYDGGKWSSSSPDILYIDSSTGLATVKGVGLVQVRYSLVWPYPLTLTTQVNVAPVSEVVLSPSKSGGQGKSGLVFSNAQVKPLRVYIFTAGEKSLVSYSGENCTLPSSKDFQGGEASPPFSCEVDLVWGASGGDTAPVPVDAVASVRLMPDRQTGLWTCLVTPRPPAEVDAESLGTLASRAPRGTKLAVTVGVRGNYHQPALSSAPLSMPLVPGFVVLSPPGLALRVPGGAVDVVVAVSEATTAHGTLEARLSGGRVDLVELLPRKPDQDSPGLMRFPVKALQHHAAIDDSVEVTFRLPLIEQIQTVTVRIQLPPPTQAGPGGTRREAYGGLAWQDYWLPALVTLLLALLIVFIVNLLLRSSSATTDTSQRGPPPEYRFSPSAGDFQRSPDSSPFVTRGSRLWSHGYSFAEPASEFRPISPYKRLPTGMNESRQHNSSM